jgi:hypothetical protein
VTIRLSAGALGLLVVLGGCGDGARHADAIAVDGSSGADGSLPECHWPSSLNPTVPDGDFAAWSVSRVYVACGIGLLDGGYWTSLGATRLSSEGPTYQCLTACEADEYAVEKTVWFETGAYTDAEVIEPTVPTGCRPASSVFTKVEFGTPSAESPPNVICCPCE